MVVKLRLKRCGKKKAPVYRIIAIDSRSPRDGKPIEELGFYNPRTKETKLDEPAIARLLQTGAQPTDTVRSIFAKASILEAPKTSYKKDQFIKIAPLTATSEINIVNQYMPSTLSSEVNTIQDEPPASKLINIWISEEGEDEKVVERLTLDIRYNINFKVGTDKKGSIPIDISIRKINPHELVQPFEIETKGLKTEWIVTSSTIKLEAKSNDSQVSAKSMSSGVYEVWLAKFSLFIPINGNSDTIQFIATPLVQQEMDFEVVVFARGEVFRQFEVHLEGEETTKIEKTQSVTIEC